METLLTAITGLVAGLTGGLLGVGGSIVMIPALTELFGPNQHLYQSTAMIMNFFVVVPAVIQHRRAGAIDMTTVVRIVPLAVVAVVVGVGVSELPVFAGAGELYLRGIFGLFLFFIAGLELYCLWRPRDPSAEAATGSDGGGAGPARMNWKRAALVALPTGLIAGLLGIGGGILAVPLQRRLLSIPLRVAIANSATVIVATSLIGSAVKNYAYMTENNYSCKPMLLAAVLIPTAIIGSLIGSRLTHKLPVRVVKAAFCVLLAVAAIRFTFHASAVPQRLGAVSSRGTWV